MLRSGCEQPFDGGRGASDTFYNVLIQQPGLYPVRSVWFEGGGGANGALLRAGLVDEISLVISPVVDGSTGGPIVFNSGDTDLGPAPIERMTLASHTILDGGVVWLRYKLGSAAV